MLANKFGSIRGISGLIHSRHQAFGHSNDTLVDDQSLPGDVHASKTVILPASIASSRDISPAVWATLLKSKHESPCATTLTHEQLKAKLRDTVIYTANGQIMQDIEVAEQVMLALSQHQRPNSNVHYLVSQLVTKIGLKTTARVHSIYAKVAFQGQTVFTDLVPCYKSHGMRVAELNYNMIFDVKNWEAMVVVVEVFGCTGAEPSFGVKDSALNSSASINTQSTLGRKLSSIFKKSASMMDLKRSGPAPRNRDLSKPPSTGIFLGTSDTLLTSFESQDESVLMVKLFKNRKDSGYFEHSQTVFPEERIVFKSQVRHEDFVNIFVRTPLCMIWKKYWAVLEHGLLKIYDYEYQESRPAIDIFNFAQVLRAEIPKNFSAPYALRLVMHESFVSTKWRETLFEQEDYEQGLFQVHIMGDSKQKINDWMAALQANMIN